MTTSPTYSFFKEKYPISFIGFVENVWGERGLYLQFFPPGKSAILALNTIRDSRVGYAAIYKIYLNQEDLRGDKYATPYLDNFHKYHRNSDICSDSKTCLPHKQIFGKTWGFISSEPLLINKGKQLVFLGTLVESESFFPIVLDLTTGNVKEYKLKQGNLWYIRKYIPVAWREEEKQIIFLRINDCYFTTRRLPKAYCNKKELWRALPNMKRLRKIMNIPETWEGTSISKDGKYLIYVEKVRDEKGEPQGCWIQSMPGVSSFSGTLEDIKIARLNLRSGIEKSTVIERECNCVSKGDIKFYWAPSSKMIFREKSWETIDNRVEKGEYKIIQIDEDENGNIRRTGSMRINPIFFGHFLTFSPDEEYIYFSTNSSTDSADGEAVFKVRINPLRDKTNLLLDIDNGKRK